MRPSRSAFVHTPTSYRAVVAPACCCPAAVALPCNVDVGCIERSLAACLLHVWDESTMQPRQLEVASMVATPGRPDHVVACLCTRYGKSHIVRVLGVAKGGVFSSSSLCSRSPPTCWLNLRAPLKAADASGPSILMNCGRTTLHSTTAFSNYAAKLRALFPTPTLSFYCRNFLFITLMRWPPLFTRRTSKHSTLLFLTSP